MNRDSMNALRLDRRLMSRRGWISRDELEHQLQALPDVSDKAQVVDLASEAPAPDAPDEGGPGSSTGL